MKQLLFCIAFLLCSVLSTQAQRFPFNPATLAEGDEDFSAGTSFYNISLDGSYLYCNGDNVYLAGKVPFPQDDAYLWTIVETDEKIKIYNKKTGTKKSLGITEELTKKNYFTAAKMIPEGQFMDYTDTYGFTFYTEPTAKKAKIIPTLLGYEGQLYFWNKKRDQPSLAFEAPDLIRSKLIEKYGRETIRPSLRGLKATDLFLQLLEDGRFEMKKNRYFVAPPRTRSTTDHRRDVMKINHNIMDIILDYLLQQDSFPKLKKSVEIFHKSYTLGFVYKNLYVKYSDRSCQIIRANGDNFHIVYLPEYSQTHNGDFYAVFITKKYEDGSRFQNVKILPDGSISAYDQVSGYDCVPRDVSPNGNDSWIGFSDGTWAIEDKEFAIDEYTVGAHKLKGVGDNLWEALDKIWFSNTMPELVVNENSYREISIYQDTKLKKKITPKARRDLNAKINKKSTKTEEQKSQELIDGIFHQYNYYKIAKEKREKERMLQLQKQLLQGN